MENMDSLEISTLKRLAQAACGKKEMRPQALLDEGFDENPYYKFLYLLARELQPKRMVELGTLHGGGAFHLAYGNPDGEVVTIDNNQELTTRKHPHNILAIRSDTRDPHILSLFRPQSVNLLFIDSTHTSRHVGSEYHAWLPTLAPDAVVLVDDIYMGGMTDFWDSMPQPKFTSDVLHSTCGFGVNIHKRQEE